MGRKITQRLLSVEKRSRWRHFASIEAAGIAIEAAGIDRNGRKQVVRLPPIMDGMASLGYWKVL